MKLVMMRNRDNGVLFVNPEKVVCVRRQEAAVDTKSGLWKFTCELSFGTVGGFDGPDSSGDPGVAGVRVMGSAHQVAEVLLGSFTGNSDDVGWFRLNAKGVAVACKRPAE